MMGALVDWLHILACVFILFNNFHCFPNIFFMSLGAWIWCDVLALLFLIHRRELHYAILSQRSTSFMWPTGFADMSPACLPFQLYAPPLFESLLFSALAMNCWKQVMPLFSHFSLLRSKSIITPRRFLSSFPLANLLTILGLTKFPSLTPQVSPSKSRSEGL